MTLTAPSKAPATIETVIDTVEKVADEVVTLVLRRADGSDFPVWEPGAHIDVHLDNGLTRQYSLCSPTQDRSILQIGVLHTLTHAAVRSSSTKTCCPVPS